MDLFSETSSQDSGPYSLQTILDRCIAEPVQRTSGKAGTVSYNKIQSHHIEVQDHFKKNGIKEMFKKMYRLNSNESSAKVHGEKSKKLEDITY